MAKELAVSLVVGAALNKGFVKTMRSTDERLAKLRGSIQATQKQAVQIQSFRKLQGGLAAAQAAATKAQDRVVSLGRAMKQTQAPTKKMRAEMARAHQEAHRANKRFEEQRRALNEQRLAMKRSGLSTANLASQEKRLGQAVEETRRRYDRLSDSMARAQARKDRRAELRNRGLGVLGAVYSAGRVFEESFALEEQTIRLKTVINAEDGAVEAAVGRAVRHVRDVARRTLASESELLEIQYELNSAGLSEAAARAGSEVASKVATVTKGDMGQVAKGSIPAPAGGNRNARIGGLDDYGPSPRLRGKPGDPTAHAEIQGAIPAPAGETHCHRCYRPSRQGHPRACGGNPCGQFCAFRNGGPSPRLRGKHRNRARGIKRRRAIPAPAGETPSAGRRSMDRLGHPRACGGNGVRSWLASARRFSAFVISRSSYSIFMSTGICAQGRDRLQCV